MKPKTVNFSKDKSLGYVAGAVAGDGSFGAYKGGNYIIGLHVKDKDFSDTFSKHLRAIGIRPNISFYNEFFHVVAHSKQLVEYLKNLEKINIINNSYNFKLQFLRGLFDSDGWVTARNLNSPRRASRGIGLANNNKILIDAVEEVLSELGINCKIKGRVHSGFGSKKIQYELLVFGKENIQKFFMLVGFSIKRKQEKLADAIYSIRNEIECKNCRGIVKIEGHQPAIKYCKDCSRLKVNEYKRRYRRNSPKAREYNRIYAQKWREKNREKYNLHMKLYHRRYRKLKKMSIK